MFPLSKSICPKCFAGGCKACEEMAANRDKINGIKCEQHNTYVYHKLPAGLRLATIDDFVRDGVRRDGLNYLLQSHYETNYTTYVVSYKTDMDQIREFIAFNACFVKS